MHSTQTPINENPWESVFQSAVLFHGSGRLDEAGSVFAAIVEHNAGHFPSLHRLAAIRRHQDRLEESLALLERAIERNPTSADAHNSLGNTLNALDRHEDAIAQYRCAASLRENFPEAHVNLGNSLRAMRHYEEAADAYRAAIALRPGYAEAHSNLGIVFDLLNRPDDALASFTAAVKFDPGIKLGYNNLALALADLDRHEEALRCFQLARQLDPDAPEPVYNESLVQLAIGNFEQGWRDYESRWRVPDLKLHRHDFPQPMWDGRSDIAGKTILLHAEQGLGDTILFARFVERVAAKGARVVLAAPEPLAPLMRSIPDIAQVFTSGDPLPDFDLHAPLGSLPLAAGATLETIGCDTAYLRAPAESETIVSLGKSTDPRPLVGVCWAGNPAHSNDRNRSVPLLAFERLFRIPGIRFVSLQQNLRSGDDSILARYDNIDLLSIHKGSGLADTAALMSRLELVITVDTAIAHLAGALHCPVWILLPFRAYWVWLRHRADSPWYPTARLFRQNSPGDWQGALEQVGEALRSMEVSKDRLLTHAALQTQLL
jgi:tetratricopeptide (TPR) repeat protein